MNFCMAWAMVPTQPQPFPFSPLLSRLWPHQPHFFSSWVQTFSHPQGFCMYSLFLELSCVWFLLVLHISAKHALSQTSTYEVVFPHLLHMASLFFYFYGYFLCGNYMIWIDQVFMVQVWMQKVLSLSSFHHNVHNFSAFRQSGMKGLVSLLSWCHISSMEVPFPLAGWKGKVSQASITGHYEQKITFVPSPNIYLRPKIMMDLLFPSLQLQMWVQAQCPFPSISPSRTCSIHQTWVIQALQSSTPLRMPWITW